MAKKDNNDYPPKTIHFMDCPLTIEAASDKKSVPRFSMVAYTGGPLNIAGFYLPIVVDLNGLIIESQNIPVRLDHNPRQGVGHTSKIIVEKDRIIAEGFISRDTSWARDVANSGLQGFPWQASIGADIIEAEFIQDGQIVNVNEKKLKGPLYVVRKAVLKEISFVDSGADIQTSVKIAAKFEGKTMPTKQNNPNPEPEITSEPTSQPKSPESAPQAQTVSAPVRMPETVQAAAGISDPVSDLRKKLAAETQRIAEIHAICNGHAEIEAKAIAEGWDATRCELEILRAMRPKAPAVQQQPAATPKIFEAVALMAAGVSDARLQAMYDVPTLEAADRMRGIGIQEYCERIAGVGNFPRFRRDASGWLQAAFSTTSLPGILSNVANKMLLEGYNYIEDAWRQVCKIASVNDFKEHTRYRMLANATFQKVGPDGELKHGKLEEIQYGQKADTHGIMFALTRQMIINDDLGAFADIPRSIGMGAAEAIAEAVWGLLLSNPNSFFSTVHKNYKDGTDTALSVNGLTEAEILFGQQIKPNGKPLGIGPSILLVPITLKVVAEQLMKSVNVNETTEQGKPKPQANPHVGKFTIAASAYLCNSSFPGASNKAWYLFADPNRLAALEVAFLNGVDRPTVEKTDADFNTLGIQFRGYIDFGVREQDYRGAVKMKGEV